MSARTSSRSSLAAAHMTAVVPSGPGVLGLAPLASKASTAVRSPFSAAARTGGSAAEATEAETRIAKSMGHLKVAPTSVGQRTLDLRQDAAAVAQLLHRDVVAIEQCHEQIGEPRILRILQMLTTFDLAASMPEDCRRQRIVVVLVAVAHVAAEQN